MSTATRARDRRLGSPPPAGWRPPSNGAVARARRLTWYVVTGLVLMSLIPVLIIGSSPRPTDLTFEDVRLERIPAMTSWVRLEGDLRVREGGIGDLYELHDLKDDDLYVLIHNAASLPPGRQVVTGRISPRAAETGNIGTLDRRRAGRAEGQRAVCGHPLPGRRRGVRGDGHQRRLSGQAARTSAPGGAAPARTGCEPWRFAGAAGSRARSCRSTRRSRPASTRRGRARPLRRDDRLGREPRTSCAPGDRRPPTACGCAGPTAASRVSRSMRRPPTCCCSSTIREVRDRLAATLR